MRFIIYGIGAIGGTVAAALALAGEEVVGIARGAHLAAVRETGLLLRTPEQVATARFACHADPAEADIRDGDVIVLSMKTQDTPLALERLRAAGVGPQAIFCMQNGVANERMALRFFPNVYGVTVMMPSGYLVPGEVSAFGTPRHGIFEVGRYPGGVDDVTEAVSERLNRANIAAFALADVMASKHGKLLLNLRNVIEAAMGPDADTSRFYAPVRREADAVYAAAGIVPAMLDSAARAPLMQPGDIDGAPRQGGSSTQSLDRGAGSIETDYLNGEIVLLGRLNGVPTPCNSWLCGLGQRMVAEGRRPGSISAEEMARGLGLA